MADLSALPPSRGRCQLLRVAALVHRRRHPEQVLLRVVPAPRDGLGGVPWRAVPRRRSVPGPVAPLPLSPERPDERGARRDDRRSKQRAGAPPEGAPPRTVAPRVIVVVFVVPAPRPAAVVVDALVVDGRGRARAARHWIPPDPLDAGLVVTVAPSRCRRLRWPSSSAAVRAPPGPPPDAHRRPSFSKPSPPERLLRRLAPSLPELHRLSSLERRL